MRLPIAFLMCVALAACGDGKKAEPPTKSDPAAATGSGGAEPVDGPPKKLALTPQKLAPILREIGADGRLPGAVAIELATAVTAEAGYVGEDTVVKVTPATPGSLQYTSVSGLVWTPSRPLAYDTQYTIELVKVGTQEGPIEPPAGTKWSHTFKTPAFRLLGWAPALIDVATVKAPGRALMDLQFSGPVLPNVARAALEFTVNGKQVAGVQVMPNGGRGFRVLLSDPAIKAGAKLAFSSLKAIPSLADASIASARGDYTVATDKLVDLRGASVVEGANGFFLEIACSDQSTTGSEGADRCQLSDEALKQITFDPAIGKPYITSGNNGFRVFGDFKRGVYKVKIAAGATSIDGGIVRAPLAQSFVVKARKPVIGFPASGRYLPRTAWTSLGIRHTNVEAVNLIVRQIPPENLVFWLGGQDAADDRTSNVILKQTVPLRGDADASATTWLDVGKLLPTSMNQGVLELKLVGLGVTATSRLMLTNMSLVAKKTSTPGRPWEQQVTAWALGIDSTELLDGVEVTLVRRSGKVVGKCTTAGTKGCTLQVTRDADPDQAEPFALIARKGEDLTYIRYQDLRAIAESNISGAPYVAPPDVPYRATMYSDRGVYRPGDTAHVSAIVRDTKDQAPGQVLPVDVKIVDPRAKVVRKLTLQTNAGGLISFSHPLPAFADTGHWRVQLSVGDKSLAAYDLQVEEFVPERMKVTAVAKRPGVQIGEPVAIDVGATYLFGGNAMDSGVELTCSVEPTTFTPGENAELTYGVEPKGKPVNIGASRGQLDPAGKLTIACPEATTTFKQASTLTATAAVLEAGSGRTSVQTTTVDLHPEKFYLGLKSKVQRAMAGDPFQVQGLVVDWMGKPARGAVQKAQIELLHLEADYGYGYDEESGESSYDRHLRPVPEGKQEVAVAADGSFKFDVTPGAAPAGYVVRVTAGKATTELVLDGEYPYEYYNYGDGERVDSTPRPAKPTALAIKLPEAVEVGKPTKVTVKVPYKGKLLWTVETDRVVASEWQAATDAEASWSFTLPAFAPNVYVTAFLVKDPHLESKDAFMPDRALGVGSVRVTPTQFTQAVKLDVPKEIRSSSPLTVKLSVGAGQGPTFATVAVVDEGILSLTKFKTPDPLAMLFGKRALAVETYETLGWTMLHQPQGASSKTGGGDESEEDGAGSGGNRVQPVKPVALFSGIVQVGADGTATIPFTVPSYRGQLRVMAVTASAGRVGRAEAQVTVRDPVVVQVTFPRFLSQNDELQIPVFLTNVSGGPVDVELSIASAALVLPGITPAKNAGPPLTLTGKSTGSVKLQDGRAETLVFSAKAALAYGGAKLTVTAKVRGAKGPLTLTDQVEVPFLPAGPRERIVQKIKIEPGVLDLRAQPALQGWVPTSERTTLWMTTNPYAESFDHLKYLLHYPYGCLEQTASSSRPLLYVGNLVQQIDPELGELQLEDMVLSGINRILSMETPAGGFGYWPGATEPLEWATAYATHFLLDAKKQGYAVPDDRLADVLKWMETRVAQRERGQRVQANRWNYYDEQAEAYMHYVLAVAGKGNKGRIGKLITGIPANSKGELAEGLYLLKAALYHAGDRRYERDLRTLDSSPLAVERVNSWSFYSDLRRRGLMLSTYFDLFGNNPAGEPLAQRVAGALAGQSSGYYTTQELVWAITGLGKWVKATAAKGATAAGTLTADGAPLAPRKTKAPTPDKTWAVSRASEYGALSLDVPPGAAGMWLVISSEGVREGGDYKVGGNGLSVARTFRNLEGTEIDPATDKLSLGDLLFVEVTLGNTSATSIQNVALVDRLPAGFEIENPKLGRTIQADWVVADAQWQPDFMNLRDDRLQAFGEVPAKSERKVIYTVRAVTSGTFTIPPVEAEAMYDPTLWARAKGGTAVVGGPWTGKTL